MVNTIAVSIVLLTVCVCVFHLYRDLGGECAVYLAQEVVHLLASVLVHRGAHRPDEAEEEPELHHVREVFRVGRVHLGGQRERERGTWRLLNLTFVLTLPERGS